MQSGLLIVPFCFWTIIDLHWKTSVHTPSKSEPYITRKFTIIAIDITKLSLYTTQGDLKKGDYVVVMPDEEQYAGQPWITQCATGPCGDKIKMQWLKGALSRPWAPD